jgi:hypothetical protein
MRHSPSLATLGAFLIAGIACFGARAQVSDSGSWGRNRLNQTVLILNDITTFKNDAKGRRTDETVSVVPFERECVWVGLSPTTHAYALDCRHGSSSPLAGAYFKIRFSKTHRNECGRGSTIYECTVGCEGRQVPAVFVAEPYEC